MEVIKDKNGVCLFDDDRIFIIPIINEQPVKAVFHDRYNIEENENGLTITETMPIEKAINKVKAAGNDPNELVHTLVKEGRWKGMVV